jgi:vacuole morphology and inheritance protein 14
MQGELLHRKDTTDGQLAADFELSVKNGAELLDRLIKDIVSESASTYVSVLQDNQKAFSLAKFIPLLQERITVLNPYTRTFLVGWITLLDSIPDLELVTHLPSFLGGLFKFLSDSNQDVHTTTQTALDRFLAEIKKIARLKRGLGRKRAAMNSTERQSDSESDHTDESPDTNHDAASEEGDSESVSSEDEDTADDTEDWVPGQDVRVDHGKLLEILVAFLGGQAGESTTLWNGLTSTEQEIQLTALRWIDSFFEISPEDILAFVPRLLTQLLPALAHDVELVRHAASRVNTSLMDYILTLPDEGSFYDSQTGYDRRDLSFSASRVPRPAGRDYGANLERSPDGIGSPEPSRQPVNLDWDATVTALTLQFLNEHENTRVAALNWLIMLHRKAPAARKVEINDNTFPALLKTLSDTSEVVVTRDLVLLSQMSRNSEDHKFAQFMVNLLSLFSTDRKLLETRGNLIIRQLSVGLNAERIFRTLADCIEKEEDVEFASIMIQNLNNNLITAPELADLRRRLRNLDTREGQTFFIALFRSWCHNAVATFSLCLLAQAYEQAYHLLQIFGELEMTLNMLIQMDKLVQLLESPVFTCRSSRV